MVEVNTLNLRAAIITKASNKLISIISFVLDLDSKEGLKNLISSRDEFTRCCNGTNIYFLILGILSVCCLNPMVMVVLSIKVGPDTRKECRRLGGGCHMV